MSFTKGRRWAVRSEERHTTELTALAKLHNLAEDYMLLMSSVHDLSRQFHHCFKGINVLAPTAEIEQFMEERLSTDILRPTSQAKLNVMLVAVEGLSRETVDPRKLRESFRKAAAGKEAHATRQLELIKELTPVVHDLKTSLVGMDKHATLAHVPVEGLDSLLHANVDLTNYEKGILYEIWNLQGSCCCRPSRLQREDFIRKMGVRLTETCLKLMLQFPQQVLERLVTLIHKPERFQQVLDQASDYANAIHKANSFFATCELEQLREWAEDAITCLESGRSLEPVKRYIDLDMVDLSGDEIVSLKHLAQKDAASIADLTSFATTRSMPPVLFDAEGPVRLLYSTYSLRFLSERYVALITTEVRRSGREFSDDLKLMSNSGHITNMTVVDIARWLRFIDLQIDKERVLDPSPPSHKAKEETADDPKALKTPNLDESDDADEERAPAKAADIVKTPATRECIEETGRSKKELLRDSVLAKIDKFPASVQNDIRVYYVIQSCLDDAGPNNRQPEFDEWSSRLQRNNPFLYDQLLSPTRNTSLAAQIR